MPTVNIQISDVKEKQNIIHLKVIDENNRVIERTLRRTDIDNWNDFATWLVNQSVDYVLLPDKEKSLRITFHTETETDPETGLETTTRVVDDIIVT